VDDRDALREHLCGVLEPLRTEVEPLTPGADVADLIPESLRPAAVLMPLVPSERGWEFLLTRRTEHLKHHAGQIAFAGGRMEPGDRDLAATALRVAQEEVGLPAHAVEILGALAPLPTITGFQVLPVVGLLEKPMAWIIDPSEVDEAFLVPVDFALDPANRQRQSALYRGRRRHFDVIRYGRHTIWGATASMLVELGRRWRRRREVRVR